MIALVELGRYIEAEREAQTHPTGTSPPSTRPLRRRPAAGPGGLDRHDRPPPAAARAGPQAAAGIGPRRSTRSSSPRLSRTEDADDPRLAVHRRGPRGPAIAPDWKGAPASTSERLLRDLGDTYSRLEAYSLDIDVQRLRLKNNAGARCRGSTRDMPWPWPIIHTGQFKDAAQLIDATAILHPDLGGGELHEKFIRLRQRLGEKP